MPVSESVSTSDQHQNRLFPVGHLLPFVLVTALFFLWGIPNNLNDVLIRQFMKSFAISRFQAGLVQSAFYLGYFVLAMPAALMMRKKATRQDLSLDSACMRWVHFCSGRPPSSGVTNFFCWRCL